MINVDTVYQTVQALANKEQRGYVTPQEFNLFANQVQSDMFEQYLYNLNARSGDGIGRALGDATAHILHKIENTDGVNIVLAPCTYFGPHWLLPTLPNTGRILANDGSIRRTLLPTTMEIISDLGASRWHNQGFNDYGYFEDGVGRIQVWTGGTTGATQVTTGIEVEVINGKPGIVSWGYTMVNEQPLYNPSTSNNFSLHFSERADVVVNILKLVGISIEDQQLHQAASAEVAANLSQES